MSFFAFVKRKSFSTGSLVATVAVFVLGFMSVVSTSVSAGIVSGFPGGPDIITPPPSVLSEIGTDPNNTISVFLEREALTLTQDVDVDVTALGSYQSPCLVTVAGLCTVSGALPTLTPGVISIGTKIDSYFVHFNPIDKTARQANILFDQPILGIILLDASLDSTDFLLGAPGTSYPTTPMGRGLEMIRPQGGNFDRILFAEQFGINGLLHVALQAQEPGDQIRILTASAPEIVPAVSEPTTLALFGMGLLGLAAARRGRKLTR